MFILPTNIVVSKDKPNTKPRLDRGLSVPNNVIPSDLSNISTTKRNQFKSRSKSNYFRDDLSINSSVMTKTFDKRESDVLST